MARNHKFFFDQHGSPRARGPASEKMLMNFLEQDVQGSDHVCRDLMEDLTAIEDESDDSREFIGNAHAVVISPNGVTISSNDPDRHQPDPKLDTSALATSSSAVKPASASDDLTTKDDHTADGADEYLVPLKHFREVLEDWEAFILDDQIDDGLSDDDYL